MSSIGLIENTASPPLAAIFGLAGTALTDEERDFFAAVDPLGFILFARNIESPEQVRALTQSLHECAGREAPILVDQEGGRVQRLKPPHGTAFPPAQQYGDGFTANFAQGRKEIERDMGVLARELAAAGINVNCAPVLDVRHPQTHESLGDRIYSDDPQIVAALGAAVCRAFLGHGVIPVLKHLPGLGRANLDTHHELPVVDAALTALERTDFRPFREVRAALFADALWGMAGHAVYKSVDENVPGSCSRRVVFDMIRQTIGFRGLLLSDDITMGALARFMGPEDGAGARAAAVLRAGCDIALHCNGKMDEMRDVAGRIEKMTNEAVLRYNRSADGIRGHGNAAGHTV